MGTANIRIEFFRIGLNETIIKPTEFQKTTASDDCAKKLLIKQPTYGF